MALLVSWSNSCPSVSHALISSKNFSLWLAKLVLEDPDPTVRREISTALFRLCTTNLNIASVLLLELIKFIEKAERMRPQRHEVRKCGTNLAARRMLWLRSMFRKCWKVRNTPNVCEEITKRDVFFNDAYLFAESSASSRGR